MDEIIDRYIKLLDANPICDSNNPTENSHLVWMLLEIKSGDIQHTKAHRWLGYIQGIMVSKGLITVNEERDKTRAILTKIDSLYKADLTTSELKPVAKATVTRLGTDYESIEALPIGEHIIYIRHRN